MNILIFSDLHGKLLLPFIIARKIESSKNIKIDYILQCGDAGVFPDLSRLDRATLIRSEFNRNELGFNDFFTNENAEARSILNMVDCPMICVRGNHEDHAYLDELENKSQAPYYPVDYYKKIFIIKTGEVFALSSENEKVNIMDIGRAGRENKKSLRFLQEYERSKLHSLPKSSEIDVLITHDAAYGFDSLGFGMIEIREILDIFEPLYHFYGHTDSPFSLKTDENGYTSSVKVAEIKSISSPLPDGSIILLTWHSYDDNYIEKINNIDYENINF
jgi:predicted phosphodiesterase